MVDAGGKSMADSARPVRLVMAEDHAILREGLIHLLHERSPQYQVVAQASNGEELVELARQHKPDAVIVDANMSPMNGIEATRVLKQEMSQCRVLMLTSYEDAVLFNLARQAGVDGYIHKRINHNELVEALEGVLSGSFYVSPRIVQALELEGVDWNTEIQSTASISKREWEVLNLVAEGKRSKDIAEVLFISVKTVEKHRANIMHKLKVTSLAQLVAWAQQMNFLTESSLDEPQD